MRTIQIALIFAALALTPLPSVAQAPKPAPQTTQIEEARTMPSGFRPAVERAESARRLAGIGKVLEKYLNSPFSLTPRQTYVPNRGWLMTRGGHDFDPVPSNSVAGQAAIGQGRIGFFPTMGTLNPEHPAHVNTNARVNLKHVAGKRFLVECMVTSSHTISARTASISAQIKAPDGQWLSIVTAPGENYVSFSAEPSERVWYLMGCEITRIQ